MGPDAPGQEFTTRTAQEPPTKAPTDAQRYREMLKWSGRCMSCIDGPPEPYGCTDCLNTGWQGGDPFELIGRLQAENAALRAKLSDEDWQPRKTPLGEFCDACQAIPVHGYCLLAGCPRVPKNQAGMALLESVHDDTGRSSGCTENLSSKFASPMPWSGET